MVPRAGVEPARPFGLWILSRVIPVLPISYETIQASIYAPGGRQGINSAGLVSTHPATILGPSLVS
jgi:hypothetical protein